jgi:hypothetical protein
MRGAAHLTLCAITLMAVLWLSNKARPGARRRVSRLSLSAARFIHRESPLTLHSAVLDRSPSSRVAGAVSGSLPGTLGAAHLGDDARYRRRFANLVERPWPRDIAYPSATSAALVFP